MTVSPGHSVRFMSDAKLLAQCRFDISRGSGPGGQKRNKTSNAVRLTHLPTSIHAVASESRSQSENKTRALRRLRLQLAIRLREPIAVRFEPPDWFIEIRRNGRIDVSHRHPFYVPACGLVLDLLGAMNGNPASVGVMLGVPTTAIVRLLETDSHLWEAANRVRGECGELPLNRRR